MEVWVWAFLGGMVGAVFMDVMETCAAKIGITSGVNIALVGRWSIGLLHGQLAHGNILESKPFPSEDKAGWAFHLLVGGGCVALLYPLFFQITGLPFPNSQLIGGLLFGLSTSLLPWFIFLPALGWGVWGRRGPNGSNALLASPLSHIPYGFGVGAVITAGLHVYRP
jgi:hypothetical protein